MGREIGTVCYCGALLKGHPQCECCGLLLGRGHEFNSDQENLCRSCVFEHYRSRIATLVEALEAAQPYVDYMGLAITKKKVRAALKGEQWTRAYLHSLIK